MVDRQHLISHRVLRSSKKIMIFYLWKIITFFENIIIIIFHTGKKDEDHLYIWVNFFHHNDYYYLRFLFLFTYLFFFSKVGEVG